MTLPRTLHILLLASAGGAVLYGQQKEKEDELTRLKARWQETVAAKTQPLRAAYDKALEAEELKLQAAGNYEAADTIHAERARIGTVRAKPPASSTDRADSGTNAGDPGLATAPASGSVIELDPKQARLGGGLKWDDVQNALTGWTENASARWALPAGISGGGYEIEITSSCTAGAGGKLLIGEGFYSLEREIANNSGWDIFTTRNLGTLRVKTGSPYLELTARGVKGPALMRLRSIRLLPSVDP